MRKIGLKMSYWREKKKEIHLVQWYCSGLYAFWSREKVLHNSSPNEMRDHSTKVIPPSVSPPCADGVRWYSPEHQLERCGQKKSGDEPTGRRRVQEVLSTSSLSLSPLFDIIYPHICPTELRQESSSLCSLRDHPLLSLPTKNPQLCCCSGFLTKCREASVFPLSLDQTTHGLFSAITRYQMGSVTLSNLLNGLSFFFFFFRSQMDSKEIKTWLTDLKRSNSTFRPGFRTSLFTPLSPVFPKMSTAFLFGSLL